MVFEPTTPTLARFRSIARERLHARGDVGRFPEHFAARVDDEGSGIEADAGGEFRRLSRVPGVELRKRALDRERRAHRAFGVVLMRMRIADEMRFPPTLSSSASPVSVRALKFFAFST